MSGTVGVLLPARLETRFDRGDDGRWWLRVLVVPGATSVDVHDASVDADEWRLLETAVEACGGDFGTPEGEASFAGLADAVGPARALWLARVGVDAPDERASRTPATLRGLPPLLELTAETDAGDVPLATLRPRRSDLPLTPPGSDDQDPDAPVFWAGWSVLRRAGLTARVDLDAAGVAPEHIRRLVLVGVGEEPPEDLFAAHAHAGNCRLLAPGTRTNVGPEGGGVAAPTATDLHPLVRPAAAGSASQELSRALTGDPLALPPLLGGAASHRSPQLQLARVAWPALWGHAAQDLWGPGDHWTADELGRWVCEHLLPDGPLPTLLVDDQPYGVLPLSPLDHLADGTDPVEDRLAPGLHEAVRLAREVAREDDHTVVDADTERLLRVLGQSPSSARWSWRWSVPVRAVADALADPDSLLRTQADALSPVLGAAGHDATAATTPPVAVGRRRPLPHRVASPPARPDDPATAEQWALVERMVEQLLADPDPGLDALREAVADRGKEEPLRVLLADLVRRTSSLPGDPHQSLEGRLEGLDDPAPDSLLWHLAVLSLRLLWRWGRWAAEGRPGPFTDGRSLRETSGPWPVVMTGDPSWAMGHVERLVEALRDLATTDLGSPAELDRRCAAMLDTATHRLDAWAVSLAWRRLEQRDDVPRVLGLCGWVDAPFRGRPGLGEHGMVLAPSPDQAKAAAIVRDRAVEQHLDGTDPERWDVPLDSERVRTARRLAEAVRGGAHPSEAWGREFERLVPPTVVRALREVYPAHAADAGRRTCDGLRVARAVRTGDLTAETGFTPDAETARRFDVLSRAPGDLADLQVLEAVHDTVTGGAAQTALALDAGAGLATPPDLRFPATPAPGTSLRTTVTVLLPDAPEATGPLAPGDADPAVAALLTQRLGDPGGPEWTWGGRAGDPRVTLLELGLVGADLLGATDDTLRAAAARRLGVAVADVSEPPALPRARALVATLARCAPPDAELPTAAVARLRARRDALRNAGEALLADLRSAALAPDDPLPDPLATAALRWGLAGTAAEVETALALHLDSATPTDDPVADLRDLASVGRPPGSTAQVPVLVPGPAPGAGDTTDAAWRRTFAHVRPAVAAVPEGWVWRHHADDDPWTGRPDGKGRSRRADVLLAPDASPWPTGPVVVGVLDAWVETVPDGEVPATGAFSFRTPRARAPQAVLLAVPGDPSRPADAGTCREVVRLAADLARVRSLPASGLGVVGALLPSAHLPAGERGGLVLPDVPADPFSRGLHARLEPAAPEAADLDRALRAEVADPVWMLARQWQLGEHAGSDASSPVHYAVRASRTPLRPPRGRPRADPVQLPGEVVLEAATTDLAVGGSPPAARGPDPWDPTRLWHATEVRVAGGAGAVLHARDHDGGQADWWSLDLGPLDPDGVPVAFPTGRRPRSYRGLPGRMRYPGAPEPGWFTLEDPGQAVTGHAPDPSHVSSLFFLDVVTGHGTDWYLTHLPTPPGHVLSVRSLQVRDSFGDVWRPEEPWPGEAEHWTTPFRTRGLGPLDLVAWAATPPPLQGDVLEQVLLGLDEDADLLWVVEEQAEPPAALAQPAVPAPDGSIGASDRWRAEPRVRYQVLAPSPGPWHPYLPADDGVAPRVLRQGLLRVAGPDGDPLDGELPAATTRFLAATRGLHEVDPAAVPAAGLRLERRWVLARDRAGLPVLWQQRRRTVPVAAPAFLVGHDHSRPG